jgi:tripartite-type tricarboxylate transporter receptor subunit TctC
MTICNRRLALMSVGAALSLAAGGSALSQSAASNYPSRAIRLIVPMPPGGGSDFWARVATAKMSELLGQPIVVENRPGAGTMIGAETAARSAGDGYTLLLGDVGTYSVNPHLYKKMAYDPDKNFLPITLTSRQVMVLAVPAASAFQALQSVVARAREQPGRLNYGSAGVGSPHHLSMVLFEKAADIRLNHVPYKGGVPLATDMVGGQLDVAFMDLPSAMPHLKAGRLRALAVASSKRQETLRGVLTVAESGFPGFESEIWQGLVAPAGTPAAVIEQINAAYAKASADPEVRRRLIEVGIEPTPSAASDLAAQIKAESNKWGRLISERKITAD